MKRIIALALGTLAACAVGLGQTSQPSGTVMNIVTEPPPPSLPRFNLEFAGGSPKDLVENVEKASGHPLNVIIPPQCGGVLIPPMKLRNVTVPELFYAVSSASVQEARTERNQPYSSSYGFETRSDPRAADQDAVWTFSCRTSQPQESKTCLFFQLTDYLESYKVEDITTAIRTGWSLLGIKSPPELKFHPETGLLIAVGAPEDLKMIDSVLQELRKSARKTAPTQEPGAPKKDGAAAKH